jgi:hypothetical protein
MNRHYPEVASRAMHRCEYCGAPEVVFNFPFEVEQILPTTLDGADDPLNEALACRACNLFKGSSTHHRDEDGGAVVPLFHPRQDQWNEHFEFDAVSGVIVGKSATGRATVALLKLNSPSQLASRRIWIDLGLYP